MRLIAIAALLSALSWTVSAAPVWQTISAEQGRRIELDRTNLKREEGGKVTATARMVLDREIADTRTGGNYRMIEATTIYDCNTRNAATIRRVFKKSDTEILREEEQKSADLPVRSGTLDDRVLREVCRPNPPSAKQLAKQVNEAAARLKPVNEALVRAESTRPSVSTAAMRPGEGDASVQRIKMDNADRPVEPALAKPAARRAAKEGRGRPPVETVVPVEPVPWSYEGEGGPENWAFLDAKNIACGSGQRQSPIDIRDGIKVDLEPIRFEYWPSHFRIVDDGHTIQVTLGDGRLTLTGKTYELVDLHFHKPSEEKINGRGFDMVAHLVHRSDEGKLAIVAVLLEKGGENALIQTLWNNLPLEKNVEVAPPSAIINLNELLPANRNYFAYMGSLTTPPCTEGVLWLVMRYPVSISGEQVGIFSRLYRNNARPVQPLGGRLIKEGR